MSFGHLLCVIAACSFLSIVACHTLFIFVYHPCPILHLSIRGRSKPTPPATAITRSQSKFFSGIYCCRYYVYQSHRALRCLPLHPLQSCRRPLSRLRPEGTRTQDQRSRGWLQMLQAFPASSKTSWPTTEFSRLWICQWVRAKKFSSMITTTIIAVSNSGNGGPEPLPIHPAAVRGGGTMPPRSQQVRWGVHPVFHEGEVQL